MNIPALSSGHYLMIPVAWPKANDICQDKLASFDIWFINMADIVFAFIMIKVISSMGITSFISAFLSFFV